MEATIIEVKAFNSDVLVTMEIPEIQYIKEERFDTGASTEQILARLISIKSDQEIEAAAREEKLRLAEQKATELQTLIGTTI